jgi:DNA-binding ferritin-like protein (Dps family)
MIVSEKRVYGKIKNIGDLVEMQAKAVENGLQAVGITDNGSMYIYDSIAEMAKQINPAKAKEILQLTDDELAEFIATRGEKDVSPVILEEDETSSVDIPEEIQEDEVIEEVGEVIPETVAEDVATFQEEVVEDAHEVGGPTDEEAEEVKEAQPVEVPKVECEDCSVYTDKIALAKASINQKIEQLDDFKEYLEGLLKTLE